MRIVAYGREATIVDQLEFQFTESLINDVRVACHAAGASTNDIIGAARSFVVVHSTQDAATVQRVLFDFFTRRGLSDDDALPIGTTIEIPVRYDGADLDDVAHACGMSIDQVIHLHSNTEYVVEFCGFAPGFAYLRGLPPQLHLPRRASPRTQVPAGSVAIAAHYSAVYPNDSPGGWHLVGTTSLRVWDANQNPPALLQPGTAVRFTVIS